VIAKTAAAREGLIAQFKTHALERAYRAIALGQPRDEFSLDTMHGRDPRDRKRFSSKVTQGKRAITHVRVLERFAGACLVECRLETGRTHQIRMHLSEAGHPLLADSVYGKAAREPSLVAAAAAIGRQALHARVLGFVHPRSGEHVHFEAEPPEDFMRALSLLRSSSSNS
jgi:23S rRNA pseudouridine1911/1915/1917 synthase